MENLCETCKFWDKHEGSDDGFCTSHHTKEHGDNSPFSEDIGENYIWAHDGGYSVGIQTGRSFGCINHELK